MDGNLYSLNKLKSDIESSKIISFLLPKDKRDKLKKLERQPDLMEKSITLFNEY